MINASASRLTKPSSSVFFWELQKVLILPKRFSKRKKKLQFATKTTLTALFCEFLWINDNFIRLPCRRSFRGSSEVTYGHFGAILFSWRHTRSQPSQCDLFCTQRKLNRHCIDKNTYDCLDLIKAVSISNAEVLRYLIVVFSGHHIIRIYTFIHCFQNRTELYREPKTLYQNDTDINWSKA